MCISKKYNNRFRNLGLLEKSIYSIMCLEHHKRTGILTTSRTCILIELSKRNE